MSDGRAGDGVMSRRIIACFAGVIATGAGVGVMKRASLGVDPFQSFMSGLDALIPLPFWLIFSLAGAAMLIFAILTDRHYIGLGTVLSILVQGYVIDWTRSVLFRFWPSGSLGMIGRGACFLVGILLLCFASAMYYEADLGVSPYDSIALILSEKYRIAKFQMMRVCCDIICVILGCLLLFLSGASFQEMFSSIGPGTLVTAFCMGPLVAWFRSNIFAPMLKKEAAGKT